MSILNELLEFITSVAFRTNHAAIDRWTIIASFWSMARQVLNSFVNLFKSDMIYQNLQPSRIKQEVKFTFISPAEEPSLINLSSGKVPNKTIRRQSKNVHDNRKDVMATFMDWRLVSSNKSIYHPIKKIEIIFFYNMVKKVMVKVKKKLQFLSRSKIFWKIALIVDLPDIFK